MFLGGRVEICVDIWCVVGFGDFGTVEILVKNNFFVIMGYEWVREVLGPGTSKLNMVLFIGGLGDFLLFFCFSDFFWIKNCFFCFFFFLFFFFGGYFLKSKMRKSKIWI